MFNWDMSVPGVNMLTIKSISECMKKKTDDVRKGLVYPLIPLADTEPKDISQDELRLFLKVTDVVFATLFLELMKLDHIFVVNVSVRKSPPIYQY